MTPSKSKRTWSQWQVMNEWVSECPTACIQACNEVCLKARYISFYLYTPWTMHLGRVPAVKTIHNPRWLWLEVTGTLTFPTDINFKRKQFVQRLMLDLRKVSILFLTQQNMKATSTWGRKLYQTAFPLLGDGIRACFRFCRGSVFLELGIVQQESFWQSRPHCPAVGSQAAGQVHPLSPTTFPSQKSATLSPRKLL